VRVSAYFPSLTLTGSYDFASSDLGNLIASSNSLWSWRLVAETLIDFGARRSRIRGQAAHDQAVAQYRETVLGALQTWRTLVASRTWPTRPRSARPGVEIPGGAYNRYQAGQVSYTDVVTAQITAYSAQRNLLQTAAQRQSTTVALIQSLGGGWRGL
jgi:outer membrane protein TolC